MPVRDSSLPLRVKEIPFQPSTLETIDFAMYRFLDEQLDLYTSTNKGWNKVPVIYKMTDIVSIGSTASSDQTIDLVLGLQKQFGKIGSVLSGYSCNQGCFLCHC